MLIAIVRPPILTVFEKETEMLEFLVGAAVMLLGVFVGGILTNMNREEPQNQDRTVFRGSSDV